MQAEQFIRNEIEKYLKSKDIFNLSFSFEKPKQKQFGDLSTNVAQFRQLRERAQQQFPNHQVINLFDHTRLIKRSNERTEEEKITSFQTSGAESLCYARRRRTLTA